MDAQAHWQALYDECRSALDAGGKSAVPIVHVSSNSDLSGVPHSPPFVAYRQDVEKPIGTTGKGAHAILRSSWAFVAYSESLSDALSCQSLIVSALAVVGNALTTTDGYTTTHFEVEGSQPLWEQESSLYAAHFRVFWERSL